MTLTRRLLLAGAAAAAARAQYQPRNRYRVVIAGHTGRGNFGHGWEMAWNGIPNVTVAAVSDPDAKACEAAGARAGAARTYAGFGEMIRREKPDIVTIAPRWCDQRRAMIEAAVEVGAHILIEKPLAATLAEADEIVKLTESKGLKVQVGHTARVMAVSEGARELLGSGGLGTLLEIRARGKEDRRAGGEDLIVLGTHCFDLMRYYGGDPLWVFAHATEKGREVTPQMMRQASEPVGQVGGDNLAAMFLFPNGVHGYFGSMLSADRSGRRFGVTLAGSAGQAYIPMANVPSAEPWVLKNPAWVPEKGETWERIRYPESRYPKTREEVNRLMALDLIEAIEKNREPVCGARDGLWTIEMVEALYQSQMSGARVAFPLVKRA